MSPTSNQQQSSPKSTGRSPSANCCPADHSHRVPAVTPSLAQPALNSSEGTPKNWARNKKVLHQRQSASDSGRNSQQQQQQQQQQPQQTKSSQTSSSRRPHKKGSPGTTASGKPSISPAGPTETGPSGGNFCSTLESFSARAQEIKADIYTALERQSARQGTNDQPPEVVKLKDDILKLSGLEPNNQEGDSKELDGAASSTGISPGSEVSNETESYQASQSDEAQKGITKECQAINGSEQESNSSRELSDHKTVVECKNGEDQLRAEVGLQKSDAIKAQVDKSNHVKQGQPSKNQAKSSQKPKNDSHSISDVNIGGQKSNENNISKPNDIISNSFESLNANMDLDSKYLALVSGLQKLFVDSPHMLEPVCRKLVSMSEENSQLTINCERYQSENQKLQLVKQKLENLCRELQKSNNAIRIESLSLIKAEQGKAKEQTAKIQSTLSGVIKLFDENQQRNMTLRLENQELQSKLKSLLDHCDNWEKSVETTLRQKEIENRLIRTELAKANLAKNEEKEKFLNEKKELLQILSMMQEQQHRIEGQEAKLRSDLSSYASKYDECQAVISKGMNKFQIESKRMLKQIEKSKEDYKVLLTKYESTNRKMAQLLEEKQQWDRSMTVANKKVETLEKLCRALKARKVDSANVESSPVVRCSGSNKSPAEDKTVTNEIIPVETAQVIEKQESPGEDRKELEHSRCLTEMEQSVEDNTKSINDSTETGSWKEVKVKDAPIAAVISAEN